MPTIKRIAVAPYNFTLKSPLQWGSGHVMPSLEHVLVRVELSNGATGIAEANPRPTIYGETPESVEAIIRRQIAPELVGQPIDSIEDIASAIKRIKLLKNNNSACAAVDIALWGALAKSQNTSLIDLLGVKRNRVRVSYILGKGDVDTVMREVESVYNAGVRVLKVKTGTHLEQEVELIKQITKTYADMRFYIDANEGYTPENAVDMLTKFAELGARYCEEPLPVNKLWERANLRELSPLPLIGDDSCFTYADLERELTFNTFDILNIKPPRNGFTESRAMVEASIAANKGVMLGSQASSILGCLHTLIFAMVPGVDYPSEGTFFLKVEDSQQLPIRDGYIYLDDIEKTLLTEMPDMKETAGIYWNAPNLSNRIDTNASRKTVEMLSQLALESRSPLNAITGYADLIRDSLKDPNLADSARDDMLRHIDIMSTSGENLIERISTTLILAQINAGSYVMQHSNDVSLIVMIEDLLASLRKKAKNARRKFTFLPARNSFEIQGDARRIKHALSLLFNKIIGYTETNGEIIVSITNHTQTLNDIQIKIETLNHRNMPEDTYAKEGIEAPETFILNYIVKQHHGDIQHEYNEKGITLRLNLPLTQTSHHIDTPIYRDEIERSGTDYILDLSAIIQNPLMELKAQTEIMRLSVDANDKDTFNAAKFDKSVKQIRMAALELNEYIEPALQTAYIQAHRNHILRQELQSHIDFHHEMMTTVSQNLRPLLSILNGYVEMIQWEYQHNDTSHFIEYLHQMESSIDQLLGHLDDVLKNSATHGFY